MINSLDKAFVNQSEVFDFLIDYCDALAALTFENDWQLVFEHMASPHVSGFTRYLLRTLESLGGQNVTFSETFDLNSEILQIFGNFTQNFTQTVANGFGYQIEAFGPQIENFFALSLDRLNHRFKLLLVKERSGVIEGVIFIVLCRS